MDISSFLDDPCPRCKGAECFDGPLCEDCLGMVIMGLALQGEYGESEKRETEAAIKDSYWLQGKYKSERMRLIQIAKHWS